MSSSPRVVAVNKRFVWFKTRSDTLGYTAADFATCLGVHKQTFQKYANSNTAFEEIIPYIKKKKTASNRCYTIYKSGYIVHVFVVSLFSQDGTVILRTITHDWASNLTLSAKKNDFVFKCIREAGAHKNITSKPSLRWDMWNLTDVALKINFQVRLGRCLTDIGQKNSMISV